MKSWGAEGGAGGMDEELGGWRKSWGARGSAGGADEELRAGGSPGGVDEQLGKVKMCWWHGGVDEELWGRRRGRGREEVLVA